MSNAFLLAIDQGTTSTRAMVFNPSGKALATAQRELSQIFPKPGWVEHDPDVIWQDTKATCREAVEMSGVNVGAIAGIGITNQRADWLYQFPRWRRHLRLTSRQLRGK